MSRFSLKEYENANAFAILGYVAHAMKKSGKSKEEVDEYYKEATRVDYDYLKRVSNDKIEELNKM
ncbi:MAG: hypothetical protein MJZ98_00490 [Paludibacteraceae bacterium]|nr:hypothetical protein [Paludibacteraceae bacterium]